MIKGRREKARLTFKKFFEIIRPVLPVAFVVAIFEPNQSAINMLLTWSWSEAETRILTDATFVQLKLGNTLIQSLIEDQQHQRPECCQTDVKDDVENDDFDWRQKKINKNK